MSRSELGGRSAIGKSYSQMVNKPFTASAALRAPIRCRLRGSVRAGGEGEMSHELPFPYRRLHCSCRARLRINGLTTKNAGRDSLYTVAAALKAKK
jgi:hypothetical protein